MQDVPEPERTNPEAVKNGLVVVQTGLMDGETFVQVRRSNGYLVSNRDGEVYVITTRSGVSVREKDRAKAGVDENAAKAIRIIVRGDVASELTEMTSSKKQDFCILQANNVVRTKGIVTLRSGNIVSEGQEISALGFPSPENRKEALQYEVGDVVDHPGKAYTPVELEGTTYIRHSGVVKKSFDGSVLVDKEGYVVGMNIASKNDEDWYYALPIQEVEKVLDNYGIPYISDRTEDAYAMLYERCQRGIRQDNQSGYTVESKGGLEDELEASVAVMKETPYDLGALLEANDRLERAQKALVRKMAKTTWIIIVLGMVLFFILLWFIRLFLWRRKNIPVDLEHRSSNQKKPKGTKSKRKKLKDTELGTETSSTGMKDDFIHENDPEKTIVSDQMKHVANRGSHATQNAKLTLYWNRKEKQISVNKVEFVIGKKKESVDFAIEDNRRISRVHASILTTGTGFNIVDLHSSNGTYLNEMPVSADGEILKDGDLLRLADEEFVVEIG